MIRLKFLSVAVFALLATAVRADVIIFAASSLKEPLDEIAARFDGVTVSYAGSGLLARQVGLGAPADIVILANPDWMDVLRQQRQVQAATIVDIASNRLVLIGPSGAVPVALKQGALLAALGDGRIATGLTEAVPAGIYAKAALMSSGLWGATKDRLAEVDNVRSALALVARGQAPLGIVYRTDARITGSVAEVAEFPAESHPPIRYMAALTAQAAADAAPVLAYLTSAQGQSVFAAAGFLPPTGPRP